MTTLIDYALMAGDSYIATRPDPLNKFPVPQGWAKVINPDSYFNNPISGFEAISFTNGSEIVISFAGTYPKNLNGDLLPIIPVDLQADIGLATGFGSDQLLQAAEYYLNVKMANPAANITFTGHSLGGGLAALMGVFFNQTTVTFNQAPFLNSATVAIAINIFNDLIAKFPPATNLQVTGILKPLADFIATTDLLADTLTARAAKVTGLNTTGEFLSVAPLTIFNKIGAQTPIDHGPTDVAGTDLHAQSLLTAFLQSEATATTSAGQKQSLSQVTYKLTDLLKMIFDDKLYLFDTDTAKENFLECLIRHEAGNAPLPNGGTVVADAMVTRFTSDLWKLAQDGGMTMTENASYSNWNNVSKALIAFAMQKYYEENNPNVPYGTELFTDLATANEGSNGIRFDMHDVSSEVATAMDSLDPNVKVDLSKAKGYQYFVNYLDQTSLLSSDERSLIKSMLPVMRDWYIQAGTGGMVATDTLNRGVFMLGGNSADTLMGGTAADLLVGNAGNDILVGGQGNDTLLGGSGNDSYVYAAGDGLDTILDTSGQNTLAVDGVVLDGGNQYGDNRVHRSADGHLYVQAGDNLIIDGNIVIQNYAAGGSFGLNLSANPVADPVPTNTIVGDLAPIDQNTVAIGVQLGYDPLGNVKTDPNVAETGRADTLYGSSGNDVIEGRAGSDILAGNGGDDRIYADSQIDVATAISNGNIVNSGSGLKGDWLAGGDGNDTLVGSTGNDVLMGGSGSDLLIAGAGNDDIMGDSNWVATNLNWSVTDQPDGTRFFYPVNSNAQPTVGGADVIYAGEGNDHVWGDLGNDVIFGEGGNDVLQGGSGNDTILGGSGNDFIYGEGQPTDTAGNDYLDGGTGNDVIFGNAGDDILISGAGDDTLYGGTGQDTYIFNRGDGTDTVYDIKAENNILRFGGGISSSDVTLRLGSLMLDLGNGDAIHLKNMDENDVLTDFNQNDVFNSSSISSFQFADGTTLTTAELLARGFDLDGTAGDDVITGTNTTDRINGLDGDDTLYVSVGDAANDEINQLYRYAA